MAEVGIDCHIKLTHPDVEEGQPCGFLLESSNNPGAVFSIQRQVDYEGNITIRVFFDVLAADDLINPNGSQHVLNRGNIYQRITAFLICVDGISVETPVGIFSNIGAQGHSATELHYGEMSVISCQLNNVGPYYPPANAERFYASIWDGDLSWAESYWR
ncbi:MAG: hypothetical protein JEZ00_07700 [Anaerolineaceae bacterium]|nr:hypothetical protein [Anaerolineaceae bacterium]